MPSLIHMFRQPRSLAPMLAAAVVGATVVVPLVSGGPVASAAVVQSPGITPGQTLSGVVISGGTAAANAFSTWRGAPVQVLTQYTATNSWSSIANVAGLGLTKYWIGLDAHRVWSVPLIPSDGSTTLATVATGADNKYFAQAAAGLIAGGDGNATIRLGWEMTGDWFAWNGIKDPAGFAGAFRQAVTAMRGVPGAHFTFDFNVAIHNSNPAPMYPGDAYVDFIGADNYDASYQGSYPASDHAKVWAGILGGNYGLDWLTAFATQHGKRMSLPEWGMAYKCDGHGGGDDPYFVDQIHNWVASHNVAYESYFEANDSDCAQFSLTSGHFPNGAAEYQKMFSKPFASSTPPTTAPAPALTTTVAPAPAPAPTTTVAPAPTTTVAPAPTTTVAPAPTTTVAPAPTTTVAPAPTTTVAPAPTTTVAPAPTTTVAPAPTTTVAPAPTTTVAATKSATPAPTTPPATAKPTPPAAVAASLMLSYSPDRSWPAVLNKQSLDHNVYVYYPDSKTVAKVVFSIDGKVYHSESTPAWDMAGTAVTGANAFSPKTLTAGAHTVLATVTTTSGTTLKAQSTFYVPASVAKARAVKATASLLSVSASPTGKAIHKLDGATINRHKFVRLSVAPGTVRAEFIFDSKVIRVIRTAAHKAIVPIRTASLHKGKHRLVIRMVAKSGQLSVATAVFKIA